MEDRAFILSLIAAAALPGLISLVVIRWVRPRGRWRFVPWHGILFLSLTVVLMLTAHLPSTHWLTAAEQAQSDGIE